MMTSSRLLEEPSSSNLEKVIRLVLTCTSLLWVPNTISRSASLLPTSFRHLRVFIEQYQMSILTFSGPQLSTPPPPASWPCPICTWPNSKLKILQYQNLSKMVVSNFLIRPISAAAPALPELTSERRRRARRLLLRNMIADSQGVGPVTEPRSFASAHNKDHNTSHNAAFSALISDQNKQG